MGSPSVPTVAANSQANIYQPTWESGADTQFQNYVQNFNNPYSALAGQYSQAEQNLYNNPNAQNYQTFANDAGATAGMAANYNTAAANGLQSTAQQGLGGFANLSNEANNNVYVNGALTGAQTGGALLQNESMQDMQNIQGLMPAAQSNYGAAQGALGYAQSLETPAAQNYGAAQGALGYAQGLAGPSAQNYGYAANSAAQLGQGAGAIMNTAFDPQGALYQQNYQQNQDATQASLAAMGLGTSGAGAGVLNQSQTNFNNQWQNQQLSREAAGLGAAGSAYGQGQAGLSSGLSGMQNTAGAMNSGVAGLNSSLSGMQNVASGLNSGVAGLNSGLSGMEGAAATTQGIGSQAAQNYATGGGMANNAYMNYLSGQAGLQNQIAQGNSAYGSLEQLGSGLNSSAIQDTSAAGSLGYNAANTVGNNQNSALNSLLQAGVTGQNMNQQQISDLMQYMGLGTSAGSALAGAQNQQYANQYNQYQNTLGGIGSLLGGSGGSGTSLFGSGLGLLAGLF